MLGGTVGMEERAENGQGRPSVGNVLGFSLMLRDRQALLRLERRALAPGLRLSGYEAEIPDVEFPLRAQGPSAFRHRRCRVRRLRLEVETRTVRAWLQDRLTGAELLGLRIEDVELTIAAPEPGTDPAPCLHLRGVHEGRPQWLMVTLQLDPRGRKLAIRPWQAWYLGEGRLDAHHLWRELADRLGADRDPEQPDTWVLDPVRSALLRPFVVAGWRPPDLGALVLQELRLENGRARLSLGRRGDAAEASPLPRETPHEPGRVEARLERIRAALRENDRRAAAAELERITEVLPPDHPARVAALQWLVGMSRRTDPERSVRALGAWLHEVPRDAAAARALVVALGRAGDDRALARRLAAQCRLPHPPRRRAQLELALAISLVDRLDEREAAVVLLAPLIARCTEEPELGELLPQARACLARALASTPTEALAELDRALALTDRGSALATMRAGLARALHRHGHADQALPLWAEVMTTHSDDPEWMELALAAAEDAEAPGAPLELLRTLIPRVEPERALELRRTLVQRLLDHGDDSHRELAVAELRSLVDDRPQDRELAMQLSALERQRGKPEAAASLLGRLAEDAEGADDRVRLRLEQARLLVDGGQPLRAWSCLQPALEDASAGLGIELVELAITVAPASARDALVDRLVELDDGERSGQALLARARGRSSDSKKRADLELAAKRLDDPRPALGELVTLVEDDERETWAALADAHRAHDDGRAEAAARIELAMRHLGHDDLHGAREALARARALRPGAPELTLALGWVEARAGDPDAAGALVREALQHERLDFRTEPLGDRRLDLPTDTTRRGAVLGTILLEAGFHAEAVIRLRPAVERLGVRAEPQLAASLVDALERVGENAEASRLARTIADAHQGHDRARWLARAARHAEPRNAATWLAAALKLRPDDGELVTALERAARAAGDRARLGLALDRVAHHPDLPAAQRLPALRELIEQRRRGDVVPHREPELLALYRELIELDPEDIDALVVLGAHDYEDGNELRAIERWEQALPHLSGRDPRRVEPSLVLARQDLARGRPERARDLLLPLLNLRAAPRQTYELLAEAAEALGDAPNRLRALRGIIAHDPEEPTRLRAQLQLAQQLGELDRAREALPHISIAVRGYSRGTPEHVEAARAWLDLAVAAGDTRQEAAARTELRDVLGRELSAKEIRAEALLRAETLGDLEGARSMIEDALSDRPSDDLLLSTLKNLAERTGSLLPYLVAIDAAIEGMVPGPDRDALASELALTAAELGDANRVHRALDRISTAASSSDELLDLRDWAVRQLGLEDEELRRIEERLQAGATDDALVGRLARLVGRGEPCVEHLLAAARNTEGEPARALLTPAAEIAGEIAIPSLTMRVVREALRVDATELVTEAWPALVEQVGTVGDDAELADLVALADDAHERGLPIDDRIDRLLDAAIAHQPGSLHLHRALARHIAYRGSTAQRLQDELSAHLDAVADRYELPGRDRAELFIGIAEPLDRRSAAELLSNRALEYLFDPETFSRLLQALESHQCWPEVLQLLTRRVEASQDPDDQVATLKHLAHIASEVLGDPTTAAQHLDAALELAPTDPDLLLPLLDHHFARKDLGRAIDLTERVLTHVRMGDAAFAALAHRAADAAIAQDHVERAVALLERILERVPSDDKARDRLDELHGRSDDPEQRVRLLAAVASRQSGTSRLEALEERARLLIDPLDRPTEAMEDLAAVVAEAPGRTPSVELLALLYREHERFEQLVALHESLLPRHHGPARARLLHEIATLHRDALHDPLRAEQALRLAIDELGRGEDERELADALRSELVENLEHQGRIVDLVDHLEQELAPELDPTDPAETPRRARLDLLATMARVVRDRLEDEGRAARLYEHLERWNALPDDGLATLARWYRRTRRHEDLVRVLQLRALALPDHSERRAAVDLRIAEILDGPLSRPHDAAPHYLEAYLCDPEANAAAGARARVLLSGVDSVVNVRARLLRRLEDLDVRRRPALLTLLADVLAPHEEHEAEAETRYREALEIDGSLSPAWDGLGRLLSRLDRKEEAAQALVEAARGEGLTPARGAEAAALAARSFRELRRFDEGEAILKHALQRSPDSQRALLELARLYELDERRAELGEVLDRLVELPLSSTMLAEVAYRRAIQLQPVYERVPAGPQGERARSYLLEALGANPRHTAARRALLGLATARREWSIVAHMHYLAIRDLPPGPQRAIVHLDLAATYLDHLGDPESAMRNIESALQQAATDVVVANRTGELARGMKDRRGAAERFETIAAEDNELDDAARARLWLLAADLRMEDDDHVAAEAASKRVLDLPSVPQDATAAATRTLERLGPRDPETLTAASSGVLARLDGTPPPEPRERAELLGRLDEIGRALDDEQMVERAHREQRQLAADLEGDDDDSLTTGVLLRDLFAARGEYGPVIELYERFATGAEAEDPRRAAAVLVEASGYAWRGLDAPVQAASLLGRALQHAPQDEAASDMLAELTREITDAATAEAVIRELRRIPAADRPPVVRLHLSALASVCGDEDEALALVRPLARPGVPEAVRVEALERLDALLAARGAHEERRQVLSDLFELGQTRTDPRTGDLGLELARIQQREGDRTAARRTGEAARKAAPDHRELLRLLAELAEQDEDWPALSDLYEELSELAVDDAEQATLLTRAARVLLDHPDAPTDGDPAQIARRLLLRASEIHPEGTEARVVLLPLAFRQARWDEVLELGEGLLRSLGADEPTLVLAALAEAYHRGDRRFGREIGFRHSGELCRRFLLPGLQQTLDEVALRGPLPRLDNLLGVASTLVGGRRQLFEQLGAWASERPPEAGLSLGLARLLEARGSGELARHQFQLAAFLAPRGPLPALVTRLPGPRPSGIDLHFLSTAPMESRSILRHVLSGLRDHLAGLATVGSVVPAAPHHRSPSWWASRMELAETIIEPWRVMLGVDVPVAWTEHEVPGGITVRNDRPPRIVLGRQSATLEMPELSARLAYATATIALGLAVLQSGALPPSALLDALIQLANPGHQPTGQAAQALADVLAARDAHNIGLDAGQRAGLMDELVHWLTIEDGVARFTTHLHHARLLLATRLCGHLDGALHVLGRDHGLLVDGRLDAAATLRLDDTTWLLRALSLR